MERVRSSETHSFNEIKAAAIFIQQPRPEQRHIGMLFRPSESEAPRHLHLAWHQSLNNDLPQGPGLWIHPAVPERRLPQVASICRLVWRNNSNGIPYGFSQPNDECFDSETARYLLGPTQHGLTCASFVLAVFHRAGLPLVNCATWPTGRDEDIIWQEFIVKMMSHPNSHATPEHIKAVKDDVGSTRYRPEEVAGAATILNPPPADFDTAANRGLEILEALASQLRSQFVVAIRQAKVEVQVSETRNAMFDSSGPKCYELILVFGEIQFARIGCWKTGELHSNRPGAPRVRIDGKTIHVVPGISMNGGFALEFDIASEAEEIAKALSQILIQGYEAIEIGAAPKKSD